MIWKEIHAAQTRLRELSLDNFIEANKAWWNKVEKMDCTDDQQEFWKLIRKLKTETSHTFPSHLLHDTLGILRDKEDIKNAITQFYLDIATGKDEEAISFNNILAQLENLPYIDPPTPPITSTTDDTPIPRAQQQVSRPRPHNLWGLQKST